METRKFNQTLHKELWLWLADHPKEDKLAWPKWKQLINPRNDCYACEYTKQHSPNFFDCKNCPIIWEENDAHENVCDGKNGVWTKWNNCSTENERSALARQIAESPVKEGIAVE